MSAPRAKPPSAGPHQPPLQLASAVVGVATAAMAMVVAAVRAVRDFLMASPRCPAPHDLKRAPCSKCVPRPSAGPKGKPRHDGHAGLYAAGFPAPLNSEVTVGAAGATLPAVPCSEIS